MGCIQAILFRFLRFVNLSYGAIWVATYPNVCSISICRGYRTYVRFELVEEAKMELLLKAILVGYVLYAVLGAPMVAPARERRA